MNMQEQPTCGKGLAENSALPAKMGEVLAAMVENLEAHMKALDLTDSNSRQEHEAYERLIKAYQQIAVELRATAEEMAGYRDLPMGRHDAKAMTHPRVRDAFENFVQCKQELLSLLEGTTVRDQTLLEMMHKQNR